MLTSSLLTHSIYLSYLLSNLTTIVPSSYTMTDQVLPLRAPPRPNIKRKRAGNSNRKSKSKAVECPVCLDPVKPSQIIELRSCGCKYCKSCLVEAFTSGLLPNAFPARCCGRRLQLIQHEKHIPKQLARRYKSKEEEVHSSSPAYCANNSCGQFLTEESYDTAAKEARGQGVQAGFATCGACKKKTCLRKECKRLKGEHLGIHAVCPEAVADVELQNLAARKGWKRCPKCFALTERLRGCDAMRCRCRADWCYGCGKLTNGAQDRCECHARAQVDLTTPAESGSGEEDDLPELSEIFEQAKERPRHSAAASHEQSPDNGV